MPFTCRKTAALALLAPLAASVPTAADPVPGITASWPFCGQAPDDDGRYCIVSMTRNGVPVPSDTTGELAFVDLIGSGDVRFGIRNVTDPSDGEVDPTAQWRLEVNTGSIEPWAILGAIARDVGFSTAGSGSSRTFTLSFRPTPIARTSLECHWDSGCGDDTTVADLVYDGFVTGSVSDGRATLGTSGLRPYYEGYVEASSAQEAVIGYDEEANALLVRMANPHLRSPGVPFLGSYETFLPDAFLTGLLDVADPGSLRGGSFVVTRAGGSSTVPFSLTRGTGGVQLRIPTIAFSTPTFKIRAKPTPPGTPRKVKVVRTGTHSAKVTFRAPLGDGGKRITAYDARCRRGQGAWQYRSGASTPLRFPSVSTAPVQCQVRAVNAKGRGKWSPKSSG